MRLISVLIILICCTCANCQTEFTIDTNFGVLNGVVVGEGEPLLFLNGGPGFPRIGYMDTVNQLAKNRKVIIFDQRGTGKSILDSLTVETVNLHEMIKDIERCRTYLGIDRWDVLGNSFGGAYALLYAMEYPEMVNKLILSATFDISRYNTKDDFLHFPDVEIQDRLPEEKKILEVMNHVKDRNHYYRLRHAVNARHYVFNEDNIKTAMYWFLNKSDGNSDVSKLVTKSMRKIESVKKRIKEYQGSVLLIRGKYDFIKEHSMLSLHRKLDNSQYLILEKSGHMIWLEQNERVLKEVDNFLNMGGS